MTMERTIVAFIVFSAISVEPALCSGVCNCSAEIPIESSKNQKPVKYDLARAAWYSPVYQSLKLKVDLVAEALVNSSMRVICKIAVRIGSGRKILDAKVLESSGNVEFDRVCLAALRSLEGDALLERPNSIVEVPAAEIFSFAVEPKDRVLIDMDMSQDELDLLIKMPIPKIKERLNELKRL